jgi:hypothetical protein
MVLLVIGGVEVTAYVLQGKYCLHLRQQETGSKIRRNNWLLTGNRLMIRRKPKILERNLTEFQNNPTDALY